MELDSGAASTVSSEKAKDELITDAVNGKKDAGPLSSEGQASYEDVLATAILNKAVLNGQKTRNKSDSPMSLVDSAVQTDSEMSEASEFISQKNQYSKLIFDLKIRVTEKSLKCNFVFQIVRCPRLGHEFG